MSAVAACFGNIHTKSVNLLDSLGTAKPVYIKYIRIYASGWLYDALVTDVALLAQD